MKWSDRATLDCTASAGALWATLVDGPRWNAWNPGVQWMFLEGPLAPGSLLTMKPKGAPQTAFRVEEVVPQRRLRVGLTFGPVAKLELAWTIDRIGSGTRLEQSVAIEGIAAGFLLRKNALRIASGMAENLVRLCEIARERA